MVKLDRCPVCRSEHITFYLQDQERRLEHCLRCGLVFANPQPADRDLAGLYETSYFVNDEERKVGYRDYPGMREELKQIAQQRFNIIKTLRRAPGRLLDVGTATGEFLEVARAEGWDASGIELSQFASQIAQQRGLVVRCGTLQTVPLQPESVDVVTMWDLLEHVRDPLDELRRTHRILSMGGHVVIGTPNRRSFRSRLSGRGWWAYYASREHLYYFDPCTLRILFRDAGFHPVLQRTYALDLPLAMFALNVLRGQWHENFGPPPISHVARRMTHRLQNRLANLLGGHVLTMAGQKR